MILGVGNDLIDIRRIEKTLARYGDRFYWRDMGVVNLPSGRPTLRLTGGAAKVLKEMTPEGYEARIDLTLTDDFPLAAAIVIISGLPEKGDRR